MKARRGPAPRSEGGFTSVDVAIALGLIGLMVAMGVSRVDSSAWRLDEAGQEVAQRVRAARALAVFKQHDVIVSFDVDGDAVVVHEDTNGNGADDSGERVMRYPLNGQIQFTRGSAPAYGGFDAGPVTFTDNKITIERNGSASEEGAVYVSRPGADKARAVVVNRATGYAQMHRYNGSNWISQ